MTLNPIVHFDPMGGMLTVISILVSPFLFGWAKPTPINPANFRDRRNGEVIVSLAGPASNLLMAVLGAVVIRILIALQATDPGRCSAPRSTCSSCSTSRWRSST